MIDLKLGDCIEKLKEIKNETIDCTITSPPYDNLRSYNNTNDWNFDKFKILTKELSEFVLPLKKDCKTCFLYSNMCGNVCEEKESRSHIFRPPQSYMFVEELDEV